MTIPKGVREAKRLRIAEMILQKPERANQRIAELTFTAPQTVEKVRRALETMQKIPVLETFERSNGRSTPRTYPVFNT